MGLTRTPVGCVGADCGLEPDWFLGSRFQGDLPELWVCDDHLIQYARWLMQHPYQRGDGRWPMVEVRPAREVPE